MKKTSVEISYVLPVLLASAGHLSARAQRQKGGTPLDRCVGSEVQTCRSGDIFGSKEARRGSSGLRGGDAVAHPADQREKQIVENLMNFCVYYYDLCIVRSVLLSIVDPHPLS